MNIVSSTQIYILDIVAKLLQTAAAFCLVI